MYASFGEIEKFFESSVWLDIEAMLKDDLTQGFSEITNPELNDIASINYTRGKIEIVQEMLNLKEKLIMSGEMDEDKVDEEEVT